MRPDNKYPWGPKDELGDLIANMPYPRADPVLANRIMAELKPKQPGRVQRFMMWLRAPVTLSLSPALAMLCLLVFCVPVLMLGFTLHVRTSMVSAGPSDAGGVPVAFHFNHASAKSVAVMGSFNNWDPKGYEMRRQMDNGSGRWAIEVQLSPGRHDYVFLVNGEKVSPDPDADLIQKDDYGNRNSVVFVKEGHGRQI